MRGPFLWMYLGWLGCLSCAHTDLSSTASAREFDFDSLQIPRRAFLFARSEPNFSVVTLDCAKHLEDYEVDIRDGGQVWEVVFSLAASCRPPIGRMDGVDQIRVFVTKKSFRLVSVRLESR